MTKAGADPGSAEADNLAAGRGRPSGTVTFLFTDIEGSTRLWETDSRSMATALERHDAAVCSAIGQHGGVVFATGGDGFAAVFSRASAAVAAAVAAQQSLASLTWPDGFTLRVRMGLHTGEAVERNGDYFGPAVNQAARLMGLAHSGQVVCSEVTAALLEADVPLADQGEHRLRDVTHVVRVFQVGGGTFAPLRSEEPRRGNLPAPLTSFVGRDVDLDDVRSSIAAARLVTLVGVGGMGKTRLAIHAAASVAAQFRDGAWFLELATAGDDDAVAQVVAATLGIGQRSGVSLVESIVESLRARTMLLVLDNCEHVLSPAASLAEELLAGCADVRILATSREALGVTGEQLWPVRPLALPRNADDRSAASMQLFVDRARLVAPSFDPDDGSLSAIGEICRRLDGMPLAIELAASRVTSMSAAEIAALLDERFRLLTGGRRAGVERHQSLRAAVEWSYDLLSDHDRAVFDRLAVFVGSFDTAGAADVVSDDHLDGWAVRDALASLVAKSLLGNVKVAAGASRFQMAETLRAFARERLDTTDDPDRWRHRHATYFGAFAREAAAALQGPDELAWWPRLESEIDNLRAAVTWALDHPDHRAFAVEIITDLAYVDRTELQFGIGRWAAQALPFSDDAPEARRAVLDALASYHMVHAGQSPAEVRPLAERAIANGVSPDCPAPGVLSCGIGLCDSFEDRAEAIVDVTVRVADATAAAGHGAYHRAMARSIAAAFCSGIGELGVALEQAELALVDAREADCPSAVGLALSQIGWASASTDSDRVLEALAEAVTIAERGGRLPAYALTLAVLAGVHARRAEPDEAARWMTAAVAEAQRQGDRPTMLATLQTAVIVAGAIGHHDLAASVGAGLRANGIVHVPAFLLPAGAAELEQADDRASHHLETAAFAAAQRLGDSMDLDGLARHVLTALQPRIAPGDSTEQPQ